VIWFASSLASCSTVVIKDAEFCADAGELGAFCFNTLSEKERDIPKADWDTERFGMICTKAEHFAEWKAAILKLCRKNPICTYDMAREVKRFSGRIETVAAKSRGM
jgi:hypothetical protein